jgi:hypothetical protein
MRYIVYIILAGAIIGLTFGLATSWGWNGFVPNVILLVVIGLALVFENLDYLFFATIGGIWLDISFALPIGSFTVPLIACGAVSSFLLRQYLFSEVKWQHFLGTIVGATILLNVWIWLYTNSVMLLSWYPFAVSGKQILSNLILAIIANVLLAYPVYAIVESVANSQLRWQRHKLRI